MFLLYSGRAKAAIASVALGFLASATASSAETLPGPYRGEVQRVVDGDTLALRVRVWLGHDVSVLARVRGIDAPETRARCDRERELAEAAAEQLAALVGEEPVALTEVAGGKFHGRVVADVASAGGRDVAAAMLGSGLARRYDGGRRESWCDGEAATAAR